MKVFPIYLERAIYIKEEKTIIIADLHIGIEFDYMQKGINIAMQTDVLLERIKKLVERKNAEKLIILGDLKHSYENVDYIKKERIEVRIFLKRLYELVEVWLVKGNHDGNIRSKYVKIFGSKGIEIDDISLAHGHAWPNEKIMRNKLLIIGHVHPNVRLQTKIGYSYIEPCWIRGKFKRKEFLNKYKNGNEKMEVVIMPAFNPLCGGIAVNKEELIGPIAKIMDIDNSIVYLLNGINLGRVRNLR